MAEIIKYMLVTVHDFPMAIPARNADLSSGKKASLFVLAMVCVTLARIAVVSMPV